MASTTETAAENTGNRETHGFQAEVRELLKLMIHSLYSHREIFLRELVSNASDACDRLRFAAIATPALMAEDAELGIRIEADPEKGTVTITDNGIGMSREDAVANLGTIARSGTAAFFKSLSGDEQKASAADRPVRRRLLFRLHRRRPGRGALAQGRRAGRGRRALGVRRGRGLHGRDRDPGRPRHLRHAAPEGGCARSSPTPSACAG